MFFLTLKMGHNNVLYDFAETHVFIKSDSPVMAQNTLRQSDCRILCVILSMSICGSNQSILFVCGGKCQGKVA